ncbi:hypothetical protein D3C84_749820 [compost metagenome]
MVDHAAVDLAGIDRLEHGAVAPVRGEVAFHPFQPLQGRGFTLERQHGGNDRLEVGAGRRSAPAAFPVRTGEVHQRLGQFGFRQFARVVDEYRGARGNGHPVAMGRTVGRVDLFKGRRCHRREQPGVVDQHHGRGILGQEHIRRGGRAFLHDLIAHLGVVTIAHGDLDPGFLGEACNPGFSQALVLGVVDHDAVGVSGVPMAGAQQRGRQHRIFKKRRDRGDHAGQLLFYRIVHTDVTGTVVNYCRPIRIICRFAQGKCYAQAQKNHPVTGRAGNLFVFRSPLG